jgi:hypothetical protein
MIECSFTPQGGQSFQVHNIIFVGLHDSRPPAANGHVGMRGHLIDSIRIRRRRSLQVEGVAGLENEIIKLSAATEKRAYFDGEITSAREDDAGHKVLMIRWKGGHICDHSIELDDDEMIESISVSVTELSINDSSFKRTLTA